ncbi:MAG: ABC transporter ATP-binding protein [Fimbriimonadaceae bacterium]|nr:ABC transporter ATP-binding protein [Fimbriimonadaceae bacterium]QOJ11576.1 MAG: ABC transporter ATP-binding protein [Chthonomonadaceae bacterium]RIK00313.1 MAG: ABC transporter ATP-binding protein [Armatimonadota bacterium]
MLEVYELTKEYKKLRAVDQLTFTIRPGEIVGLLGPNGAGKTTALRCIAGILRPTLGHVRINGYDLVSDQARAKANLAFVPELPSLYELLTVEEHIRFVAMCYGMDRSYEARANELMKRYNLEEKRRSLVATLSKGMRQKLAITCALIHNANVLLFDEPIVGIDPAGVAEFKAELARARAAGCSILVSTHLLDTAERLCDRVTILAKGRKIAEGTLEELRELSQSEGQTLEQVFLKLTAEKHEAPAVFEL